MEIFNIVEKEKTTRINKNKIYFNYRTKYLPNSLLYINDQYQLLRYFFEINDINPHFDISICTFKNSLNPFKIRFNNKQLHFPYFCSSKGKEKFFSSIPSQKFFDIYYDYCNYCNCKYDIVEILKKNKDIFFIITSTHYNTKKCLIFNYDTYFYLNTPTNKTYIIDYLQKYFNFDKIYTKEITQIVFHEKICDFFIKYINNEIFILRRKTNIQKLHKTKKKIRF